MRTQAITRRTLTQKERSCRPTLSGMRKPYLHIRLRARCGDCASRVTALSASPASATGGFRWILGIPDVIGDTLFSHPNAGVLGTGPRRRQPRLPVPERPGGW
jgi:hypothetical protein